jgi:hypothetical protein
VIGILERDVGLTAAGGGTLAGAGSALRDGSSLYTMVVAYSDFGGCNHMLASAGRAPAVYVQTERALLSACSVLERASTLFTEATKTKSASTLLAATRLASSAVPGLVRARVELAARG